MSTHNVMFSWRNKQKISIIFYCLLRFYGPVNPKGSRRALSVYLITMHVLGRFSPLSG